MPTGNELTKVLASCAKLTDIATHSVAILESLDTQSRSNTHSDIKALSNHLKYLHLVEHNTPRTFRSLFALVAKEIRFNTRTNEQSVNEVVFKTTSRENSIIMTLSPSGYVRMAALDALDTPFIRPSEIQIVALRLNDWVEEVRSAAKRAMQRLMPKSNPHLVAGALITLSPILARQKRSPNAFENLLSVLRHPPIRESLIKQLLDLPANQSARCFSHLTRSPELDHALPNFAFSARNPGIRFQATRALLNRRVSWPTHTRTRQWVDKSAGQYKLVQAYGSRAIDAEFDLSDLVARLSKDRFTRIRILIADTLIANLKRGHEWPDVVSLLTNDRATVIRERMAFYEKQRAESKQGGHRCPPR